MEDAGLHEVKGLAGGFAACFEGGLDGEARQAFAVRLRSPAVDLEAEAAKILDKPYGRNVLVRLAAGYGISLVRMRAGACTSLHRHAWRRELFFVRSGRLTLTVGDQRLCLGAGDWGWSTPGQPHRLANQAQTDLEVLELFAPNLLDDKQRIEDVYGRPLGSVDHRR